MSSRTMSRRLRLLLLAGLVLALGGASIWYFVERQRVCCAFPDDPPELPEAELGLMTSLPLYWPLGTGVADLAGGDVTIPWQRAALEQSYLLVPLDTLSPIPDLDPDAPEQDPLDDLTKLAIIQPRGLSPADNVALDNWVRAGGQLLIALDPALTLEYPVPFGDPRRPTASAAIPPVIDRWGLAIAYEDHSYHGHAIDADVQLEVLGEGAFPVLSAGKVARAEDADCVSAASEVIAKCRIGAGSVTVVADAAVFEHWLEDRSEEPGSIDMIRNLLNFAFSQDLAPKS